MKGLLQMAIIEMKKVTLLSLKKDKQKILKTMQHMGCVQVIPRDPALESRDDAQGQARASELQKQIARLDLTILRLTPFDRHKRGPLSLRPVAAEDQVTATVAAQAQILQVVERMEQIERTRGELRAREAREKSLMEQLAPWEWLDVKLETLKDTKYASVTLLSVAAKDFDAFRAEAEALGAVALEEVSRLRDNVNLLAAMHKDQKAPFDELVRNYGATRVAFEGIEGTPVLAIDQLRGKLARIDEVRLELKAEVEKQADNLADLRLLRDIYATERDRLDSSAKCVDTQEAFMLTGWAPHDKVEALEKTLRRISPECDVEFADPLPDEMPPTMMRNGKAVEPFESIVKMFAMPDPRGIDPTAIMMPFWICFFGMMVSDAGYGVVMGLVAAFVWWKLKGQGMGRMAFVLALGGVATVIWGAIYGGWFGVTVGDPILDPMNDAIQVLIVCISAGAVHLLFGMGVAAYLSIKRGHPLDALFDQGFWVMLLAGLGLMLVNGTVGAVIALIGGVGILLTGGRAKPGGPIKKLIGGLGALYGVTSYLSDLLSYARLFGMGLATGVIGMVINMLAGLLMGNPIGTVFAVIILIGGHTFNLAINALGAYVHSCRLQYIEFFGKFYESGGKDFRPLDNNTRYVEIAGSEQ
ncbi:MAG: V-type ATP synthase subunit I [Clostridia bacterium]